MLHPKEKPKVLFVYPNLSSFVSADLQILKRHFDVRRMKMQLFLNQPYLTPRLLERLLKGVLWADLVFCWFADSNAFFSVLFSVFFKKKTLVAVGGYDAAYVPEIDYGIFLNRWRRIQTRFVYKHSDGILVVDPALKDDIIRNTHLHIENKINVVPTGYDFNKWVIGGIERKNLVITVGAVGWGNLKRKGFETFVKAARYLPDATFVLVGKHLDNSADYLKSIATSNVNFPGFVSDSDLLRFYQEASVYCQLSRYEGLPNSLCEAMLCGCVPIGTKYCGVPTAMGNMGFYVPYGDEKATARVIQKALSTIARREDIRERIKAIFPLERRETELLYHLRRLTKP